MMMTQCQRQKKVQKSKYEIGELRDMPVDLPKETPDRNVK